jgi:plasmid maintenance system antidote protein VapI
MNKQHRPRHGWLRDALTDRGHTQHDVAEQWGVDDAVVSRFIRSGDPELTWDRAQVLCRMLGIDLNELNLRLKEGVPMRAPMAVPHKNGSATSREEVLAELRAIVQKARQLLPDTRIEVKITHGEETL